jgi:hypothetical protein
LYLFLANHLAIVFQIDRFINPPACVGHPLLVKDLEPTQFFLQPSRGTQYYFLVANKRYEDKLSRIVHVYLLNERSKKLIAHQGLGQVEQVFQGTASFVAEFGGIGRHIPVATKTRAAKFLEGGIFTPFLSR